MAQRRSFHGKSKENVADDHLNREQLNEAMKLTQITDGQDPQEVFKERSEMREEYFTMTSKVVEATRELKETGQTELMSDGGMLQFETMIKKSEDYYSKMGASTKELACDAHLMLNMGHLVLASAQQLQKAHVEKLLRPADFAEKIMRCASHCDGKVLKLVSDDATAADLLDDSEDEEEYRPKTARRRLPDEVENEGAMPATSWAAIGRKFGGVLRIVPTLSYLRPLLQDTAPLPLQPKAKKERQPKEHKVAGKSVVLSEKAKNHDDPDQSVTKELDCIRKSLKREIKRQQNNTISYYPFVIDPSSFSKSVENMFYTSFLVKDNHIKIELRDGLPMIVLQSTENPDDDDPASALQVAATADAAAAGASAHCPATHQAIVGFAFDIWEGMIDCLDIKEAAIRR